MTTVDDATFALAGALCELDLRRLYHLLQAFGMGDVAEDVKTVDKGQLLARLVTKGLGDEVNAYSPGDLAVIGFACLTGMKKDGTSLAEMRAMLQSLRGEAMASELLRRMRSAKAP